MNDDIQETIISSVRTGGDNDKITTAKIDVDIIE